MDGFFEFKHEKSRKIPHYIFNDNPIGIGTILSEWINPSTGEIISTFSIVTHKASNVLKSIHNNPKLKEPRSPLFIDVNNKSSWINDNDLNYLHNISGEIEQNLKFHEVNKLSGSFYPGNNPNVLKRSFSSQFTLTKSFNADARRLYLVGGKISSNYVFTAFNSSSFRSNKFSSRKTKKPNCYVQKGHLVGVARFELATSCSQSRRDNRATLHPELLKCK